MQRRIITPRRPHLMLLSAAMTAALSAPAMAEPVSLDLEYNCTYPLIGTQPLSVNIRSDIPTEIPVGQSTGAFDINVVATARGLTWTGLNIVSARSVEGTANAASNLRGAGGFNLDLTVPTNIPEQTIPEVNGDFDLLASGLTPPLTFSSANVGDIVITVGNLDMALLARRADGSPVIFAESDPATGIFPTPCTLLPGQDNVLTTFAVIEAGPAPAPALALSASSVSFSDTVLGASTDATLTLSNTGNAALQIDSIVSSGSAASEFIVNHSCNSISAGSSCPVDITFMPMDIGNRNALLIIASNDANSPASVPLSGNGVMAPEPDIRLSAAALDFGTVAPGTPVVRQLTITNDGSAALAINGMISLSGSNASDYSISTNCNIVAAGATCQVTVTFIAQAEGMRTAILNITSNDPDSANLSVSLSGTGEVVAQPMITVSPTSLSFNDTTIGESVTRTVTLGNAGNAQLMILSAQISGTHSTDFSIEGNCVDIAAGANCPLSIRFIPGGEGNRTALLTITSTDSASPSVTVPLSGSGTTIPEPQLTTPGSIDFGSVRLGETGNRPLTLENSGTADLMINGISLTGNAGFSLAPNSCVTTLAPGETCSLSFTFSPTQLGSASGSLSIDSNSASGATTVTLSANGIDAAQPLITISPNPVDLGTVMVGSSSQVLMAVANFLGQAPLVIESLTVEGEGSADFILNHDCTTVAVQSICNATLTFSPSAGVPRSALLVAISNDPNTPRLEVPLSGRGITAAGADIGLSATNLNFADTTLGEAAMRQLTISNTGNEMLAVSGSISGGDNDQFSFTTDGNCQAIAPGSSCLLTATFAPDRSGSLASTLTLSSNAASGSQIDIALSGIGLAIPAPVLALSATQFNFGELISGETDSAVLTLSNNGNAPLTIATSLAGSNAASFDLTGDCSNIAAGNDCQLTVIFEPASLGDQQATLVITSNDPDRAEQQITLTGRSVAAPTPVIAATPMSQNFGMVTVGDNASATIIVENLGDADLLISNLAVTGSAASDFSISDTCSTLIAAGQCSIEVTFTPGAIGNRSATLRIDSNDSDNPSLMISLSGQGEAQPTPQISLPGAPITFASTEIGASSDASLLISNNGSAPLVISDIQISNSTFAVIGNCDDIAPQADCTVTLRFSPTQTGAQTGSVTVISNDPAQSQASVAVSGSGVAVPVALIEADITSADFGSVLLGEQGRRTIVLRNDGNATLNIGAPSLSGAGAAQFTIVESCAGSLASGASCNLVVDFAPTVTGGSSAQLSIPSNADNTPQLTISLTGAGQALPVASLISDRDSIAFPAISAGNVSTEQLTLTNTGTLPLTLQIRVIGPNADAFFPFDGGTCRTLAAGASCQLGVSFSAASGSPLSASLEILSDAGSTVIALSGDVLAAGNGGSDGNGGADGDAASSEPGSSSGGIGSLSFALLLTLLTLTRRRKISR